VSQYPTRDCPRQVALASQDQSGRLQLVMVWHEVIPGRSSYDPGSGAAYTGQPAVTRWHAQMLYTSPTTREVTKGREVTGVTENEAMARAILRGNAVGALPGQAERISPARRAQLQDAKHETMFAVMAFESGDLATAQRSIERAGLLFDGDTGCQYCGGDEGEQGVYSVCRRCFWNLRENDATRTKDDTDADDDTGGGLPGDQGTNGGDGT
jgi:hypothetical protein